jgi:hypothetical protein
MAAVAPIWRMGGVQVERPSQPVLIMNTVVQSVSTASATDTTVSPSTAQLTFHETMDALMSAKGLRLALIASAA